MWGAEGVAGNSNLRFDVEGAGEDVSSFRFFVGVSGGVISMSCKFISSPPFVGLISASEICLCFLTESRVGSSRRGLLGVRRGVRGVVGWSKNLVGEEGRDGSFAASVSLAFNELHLSLRSLITGISRLERRALS